jgi:hypothetical protein
MIICPPPTPKKSSSDVREAKDSNRLEKALLPVDQDQDDQKVVMYYEYDLMFHYLLASLCRADGVNSITLTGVKTFNIVCWTRGSRKVGREIP